MSDRNRGPAFATAVSDRPRSARAVRRPAVAVASLVAPVVALLSPDTAGPLTVPSVVGVCR